MASAIPNRAYIAAPIGKPRSGARNWGLLLAWVCALIWMIGLVSGFLTSVRLLTIIGLVATVIGMARPTIGIYGITILCTMDALSRGYILTGGLLRWNTFNYLLLLAIVLNFPLLVKRRELPTRTLQLFMLLLTLHLFLTPRLEAGVQHILGALAFFGLLIYFVRAAKDPAVWQWVAVISGVLGALGGLVYFIQEDSLPYLNKNSWVFLPLTAVFSACLARSYPTNRKTIATTIWLLVIINIVWVVLSGSRGGMTIAASCLLYLLSGIQGISHRAMILAAGALLTAILLSQFTEQKEFVVQRFDKSVDSSYSLSSRTSGRSDLAIGGWRMFLQHPILGVGTGGFSTAWKELSNREGLSDYAADRRSEAHSGWVKTLAEGGVPGIALHLAFVFSFLVVGWQTGVRPLIYMGLLVTVTLIVSFISTEFQGKGIWFFAAGATVLLYRQGKQLQQVKPVISRRLGRPAW